MGYVDALRALKSMQKRLQFDMHKEMRSLQQVTQMSCWAEYVHCLQLTPSYQRMEVLSEIMHQAFAVWIAVLIGEGLTARDIDLAVRYWISHNTDDFTVTCIVAAMPSKDFDDELRELIGKKHSRAKVQYRVDPAISAGLQLIFPKFMIDNSLRRKCSRLVEECYAATLASSV